MTQHSQHHHIRRSDAVSQSSSCLHSAPCLSIIAFSSSSIAVILMQIWSIIVPRSRRVCLLLRNVITPSLLMKYSVTRVNQARRCFLIHHLFFFICLLKASRVNLREIVCVNVVYLCACFGLYRIKATVSWPWVSFISSIKADLQESVAFIIGWISHLSITMETHTLEITIPWETCF